MIWFVRLVKTEGLNLLNRLVYRMFHLSLQGLHHGHFLASQVSMWQVRTMDGTVPALVLKMYARSHSPTDPSTDLTYP